MGEAQKKLNAIEAAAKEEQRREEMRLNEERQVRTYWDAVSSYCSETANLPQPNELRALVMAVEGVSADNRAQLRDE